MNQVIVTTDSVEIAVNDDSATTAVVTTAGVAGVVAVVTEGPQGVRGPQGPSGGINVSDANKVDKSLIYYDMTDDTYKADSSITPMSLTDGGNF